MTNTSENSRSLSIWYTLGAIAMGLTGLLFAVLLCRGGLPTLMAGALVLIAAIMAVVSLIMLAASGRRRKLLTALAAIGAGFALVVTPIALAAGTAGHERGPRIGFERESHRSGCPVDRPNPTETSIR
ncbi:hypothetical protein SAMN02910418_00074 [Bowdeniella nasicola]|uniref:Uncharacterized protein n=1 Tax=Bowdeniella nasicola TaxID=208480 RepID=A0A1H3VJD9_9ACTO|nr:hypothetical protein [Bowdeniella nasicola]SDZ74354.1 hypothetical protein SAMN02910418_00074 [Bowdeniella nasicola]